MTETQGTGEGVGGGIDEQVLELVRKTQETIVEAGRSLAAAGTGAAEKVAPEASAELAKLVDSAFDFTEKVLETQREFARQVIETATRRTSGSSASGESG